MQGKMAWSKMVKELDLKEQAIEDAFPLSHPTNRTISRNRNNRNGSNYCDRDEEKDVKEDAKNKIMRTCFQSHHCKYYLFKVAIC